MAFARRRDCPDQGLKRRRQLDQHAATILTWTRPHIAHMDRGKTLVAPVVFPSSQQDCPRKPLSSRSTKTPACGSGTLPRSLANGRLPARLP